MSGEGDAPVAPEPDDVHVLGVATLLDAVKARAEAYRAEVEAMGKETPGAGAVGAAPKPKRNDPAAHLHYAQAARRSLEQVQTLLERAHAELVGHVNFSKVASDQFAAFQAAKPTAPTVAPRG